MSEGVKEGGREGGRERVRRTWAGLCCSCGRDSSVAGATREEFGPPHVVGM